VACHGCQGRRCTKSVQREVGIPPSPGRQSCSRAFSRMGAVQTPRGAEDPYNPTQARMVCGLPRATLRILSARGARGRRGEGNHPEQRVQDRVQGRERGVPSIDPAAPDRVAACRRTPPALPSLREAVTAALHPCAAQRAARPSTPARCWSGRWASTASRRRRS
jgi:hypothetical protein